MFSAKKFIERGGVNLKVALVSTEKLPVPPVSGGAVQIYIDGVLPYLSKKYEITVYTVKNNELKNEEIVNNVRFVRLDALPKEIYIDNVMKYMERDFDLIHVFNRPKWVNILSEKYNDSRFGLSLHNEMFRTNKITSHEAESCIQRVDYINTVSKFIANGVTSLYPQAESKMRVIYSGVDAHKFKTKWSKEGIQVRNKLKHDYDLSNYKVVLFVGRLCEKKGVDVLLEAMNMVMKRKSNVALMIVGSNWFGENASNKYTQKLKEISQKLKGPIIFTGFLRPEQVVQHYNLADVFVCPSQWNEPLARVHYEAMAAGLPIITTNRGGNAEVVKGYGNGFIIDDYNNPEIIANRILQVLNSPVLAKNMGIRGRKLAENKYNFERVASEIMEGFNEI